MTVPDPILERYRLGELSPAEQQVLEASLTDADRARLAELRADDAEILRRYPPRVMALAIEHKRQAQARRWVWPTVGSAAVLLGAAAAIAVAVTGPPLSTASVDGGLGALEVRAKGETRVLVYAEQDPRTPLDDGAGVAEGDTLQLALNAGDDTYAVLFSVDGRGVLTPHLPVGGSQAMPVEPGRTVALPQAYTLDDAPSFERFILVTGDAPFAVEDVMTAGRAIAGSAEPDSAPLDLPDHLTVTDHLVRKVSP